MQSDIRGVCLVGGWIPCADGTIARPSPSCQRQMLFFMGNPKQRPPHMMSSEPCMFCCSAKGYQSVDNERASKDVSRGSDASRCLEHPECRKSKVAEYRRLEVHETRGLHEAWPDMHSSITCRYVVCDHKGCMFTTVRIRARAPHRAHAMTIRIGAIAQDEDF